MLGYLQLKVALEVNDRSATAGYCEYHEKDYMCKKVALRHGFPLWLCNAGSSRV